MDSINFKYQKAPDNVGFWNGEELLFQKDLAGYLSVLKYGLSEWALSHLIGKFRHRLHALSKKHY